MGNDVTSRRLFMSHAATDKPLASLLQRTLVLAGVPRDRIFYSSDRATGIPAGEASRAHLKRVLHEGPFVVELITPMFMTRPMCLMELGAAWVLDVPTFPIVVPPLSREEVIAQIGDAHMPLLGNDHGVDELFDELHDRVEQHLDITVDARAWGPAVREFTAALPEVLKTLPTPAPSTASPPAASAPAGERLGPGFVVSKSRWLDAPYGTELVGELLNDAGRSFQMIMLSATLYDAGGRILGTAHGNLNDLAEGERKTFRLSSVERLRDVADMRVQVDGQL
jgi:hypothetical protein